RDRSLGRSSALHSVEPTPPVALRARSQGGRMTHASGPPRAVIHGARHVHEWEPVGIVKERGPTALAECWDCGGTLMPANGHGFVCATCSTLWRRRWIPSEWWERALMPLLPTRYRWRRYRVDRAQHTITLSDTPSRDSLNRA